MRAGIRTNWRARPPLGADGRPFKSWLNDRGSLTARLQSAGRFALAVLGQRLDVPTHDEARRLELAPGRLAWVREVVLYCDDRPLVFAHSVLPRRPRGPMTRWLARLGARSLGALLFAHPCFARGDLAACRLDARHPLFRPAIAALGLADAPPPALWARRSSFSFGCQSLLVTEVFSPAVAGLRSTRRR